MRLLVLPPKSAHGHLPKRKTTNCKRNHLQDKVSKYAYPLSLSHSICKESQEQKKTYSKDKVRISHKDRTLDAMFPVLNPTTQASPARKDDNGKGSSDMLPAVQLSSPVKIREISESDCFLTSVCNLRNDIRSSKHNCWCFYRFAVHAD